MAAALSLAETALLDALDGARRAALRRLGRLPGVAAARRRREVRLTAMATLSIAAAFALAVLATAPLLALSPLLFGIPHVASDLRYLVVRRAAGGPAPHARMPMLALLAVTAVAGAAGATSIALGAAAAAVLVAGLSVPARPAARALFVALVAAAALGGARQPDAAALVVAQGHNAVAIVLAAYLVRDKLRAGWIPALALGAGLLAIGLGACDGLLGHIPLPSFAGGAWQDAIAAVAPTGCGAAVARRFVALFAFAQSIHYAAWLRLVPDAQRASQRPPSFRRSFDLLAADLGRPGALAAVALSLALPAAACLSIDGARRAYLNVALFHGFLEIAVVSALVLGSRRREVPS
jgi:hypothetical protein